MQLNISFTQEEYQQLQQNTLNWISKNCKPISVNQYAKRVLCSIGTIKNDLRRSEECVEKSLGD